MKRLPQFLAFAAVVIALLTISYPGSALPVTSVSDPTDTQAAFTVATVTVVAVAAIPVAPNRAPALNAPTPAVAAPITPTTPTANGAPTSLPASRSAYVNAMYLAVVPAGERAALAGRYTLGYDLPGLDCGTGCTAVVDGQVRSSFNDTFFGESSAYQRNTLAHEAAHAYGFLYITAYGVASWAGAGGWQAEFNAIDRSFARTYDAEAWAACVAWKESGFNNRVDQITNVCTAPAAALAMAQIP
jgi:hypothetical protein